MLLRKGDNNENVKLMQEKLGKMAINANRKPTVMAFLRLDKSSVIRKEK